jgi:hypothetical protein
MRPIRIVISVFLLPPALIFLIEGAWATYHDGWSFSLAPYGNKLIWVGDQLIVRASSSAIVTGSLLLLIAAALYPWRR